VNDAPEAVRLPDGRRIAFRSYGDRDGEPVLALHGTPATGLMYAGADAAARRLGLRLICPDRPGVGGSDPAGRSGLEGVARDLGDLADRLGLPRFGLLGISGGGPYAVTAAAMHPERATALMLVAPVGMMHPPPRLPLRQALLFRWLARAPALMRPIAIAARAAFFASPDAFFRVGATAAGAGDAPALARPEAKRTVIAMTRDAVSRSVEGPLSDLAAFGAPWPRDPALVRAPASLWMGLEDRVVPVEAALGLARRIPGCRLTTLPNEGHFFVFQRFEEVLADLAGLIRGAEARSAHRR
jgi:pimeloyl-ACP methyl ester carboxylesterase